MDQYDARIEEIDGELNRITMRIAPLPEGSPVRHALQDRAEELASELMALDCNADGLRELDGRIAQVGHAMVSADRDRTDRADRWRNLAGALLAAGLLIGLLSLVLTHSTGALVAAFVLVMGALAAGSRASSVRRDIGMATPEEVARVNWLNGQREMLLGTGSQSSPLMSAASSSIDMGAEENRSFAPSALSTPRLP